MIDFQLFRIKVFPSRQLSLLEPPPDPRSILRDAVLTLPQAPSDGQTTWHVGNLEQLDASGVYFRIGRTTRTTVAFFEGGKFIDQSFEEAPYTHGVLDLELEVLGIARKPRLAPKARGIAFRFGRLLEETDIMRRYEAVVEVGEIRDPEDFILQLQSAHEISKFTVWFSRPNPWDADSDWVKPFERLLDESRGDKGKAELSGSSLESTVLEKITRSVAATADDAAAQLKQTARGQRITKRLKGSTVSVSVNDVGEVDERRSVLELIRQMYSQIRGLLS